MAACFGHRFDAVRIFADDRAAASAQQLGARAYAIGSNIVFGAGAYAPHSPDGRRLLAHELAHVVQQSDTGAGALAVDPPTSAAEREADRASDSVAAGHPAGPIEARAEPYIARVRRREGAPGSTPRREREAEGAGATP